MTPLHQDDIKNDGAARPRPKLTLDIRTLTFNLLLFALVFAVGMYFVQRSQPGVRGLRWWAAANAVGGSGFMLLSLRGLIPDFISIVIANCLLLAALFCFHEGIARFRRLPNRMPWLGSLLVTILALLLFRYTYILPSIATRIVIMALLLGTANAFDAPARQSFVVELVPMEDLQLSDEGRAIGDVLDGFYDAQGKVPCQIDGGLKCFGHPIGASGLRMIYEMYLQMNGRAGERQTGHPVFGMTHNLGGFPHQNVCAISIIGKYGK